MRPLPPVLLLHGAGGGGWEWRLWQAALQADGWRVTAPDLQPVPAGIVATTLADYRRQAQAAAAALGEPPVAVGASLGGLLALLLAADGACRAAVLVNPLPPAPEVGQLPPRSAYPALVRWRTAGRFESTRRALPDGDDSACLYAFRRWRDESGAVMNAARAGIDVAPPRCPLLVLATEQDADVPVEVSAALAARLGASLLRLPGSHIGPLFGSRADTTVKAVVGWIRRVL